MNGLPYYRRFPRDFIEGTIGMPFEMKGAYSLVLDLIYMQNGQLPDDPHYIAGLLGMSVRKWKSIRQKLIDAGKISADLGIISNSRADVELESTRTYSSKQSENRRRPNKKQAVTISSETPKANHTEPDTDIGGGGSACAREDDHEMVLAAAGIDPTKDVTGKWHSSTSLHTVSQWRRDLGLSVEEICAEITGVMRGRASPPGSLSYFTEAMRRLAGRKSAPHLTPIEGGASGSINPTSEQRLAALSRGFGE